MIDTCPLCYEDDILPFYHIASVPATMHLLCRTQQEALNVKRGVLDLVICNRCTFIFNRQFDPELLDYNKNYDNNSLASSFFQQHIESITDNILAHITDRHQKFVEIGCGSGVFLSNLISKLSYPTLARGFDPAYKPNINSHLSPWVTIYPENFVNQKTNADVVIARHLIEHIQDPCSLVDSIINSSNRNLLLILETPCSEWIIENTVFWDLFYEHCSLFNSMSISIMLEQLGIDNIEIQKVFNDQFLLVFAKKGEQEKGKHSTLLTKIEGFKDRADKKLKMTKDAVVNYNGKVAIWGVGAKGVTLANLLDKDSFLCGFEINKDKVGGYIPGTGHPIYHADSIREHDIKAIILMNPNYKVETLERFNRLGIAIEIIEA